MALLILFGKFIDPFDVADVYEDDLGAFGWMDFNKSEHIHLTCASRAGWCSLAPKYSAIRFDPIGNSAYH